MKRKNRDEIRFEVNRKYSAWVAGYGLADALRINKELGTRLRQEKKRRKELEDKK